MGLSAVVQPNKVRLPWSLRGKVEVGPLQLVGENGIGLPYIQGRIRNRSGRMLSVRMVVHVYNEQRQLLFTGTPGILDTMELDPQQQRTFRVSLRDAATPRQPDHKRMWVTRSRIEIVIDI